MLCDIIFSAGVKMSQKRLIQGVSRYAETEQRSPDFFLLWLTGTNTYLETIAENHGWLSMVPEESRKKLKKVSNFLF